MLSTEFFGPAGDCVLDKIKNREPRIALDPEPQNFDEDGQPTDPVAAARAGTNTIFDVAAFAISPLLVPVAMAIGPTHIQININHPNMRQIVTASQQGDGFCACVMLAGVLLHEVVHLCSRDIADSLRENEPCNFAQAVANSFLFLMSQRFHNEIAGAPCCNGLGSASRWLSDATLVAPSTIDCPPAAEVTVPWVVRVLNRIWDFFQLIGEAAAAVLKGLWDVVETVVSFGWEVAGDFVEFVGETLDAAWSGLKAAAADIADAAAGVIEDVVSFLGDFFGGGGGSSGGATTAFVNMIASNPAFGDMDGVSTSPPNIILQLKLWKVLVTNYAGEGLGYYFLNGNPLLGPGDGVATVASSG
jgi:hypothetical protein